METSDGLTLQAHEKHSQDRYDWLMSEVRKIQPTSKESKMGMDNVSDKVNINVGDGGGMGGGGAGLAAVIAALGNRNQGNDNAALIAALGNRNDDSSNLLGPLMAMMGNGMNRNDGMNNLWPIILLALLGRGRGGLFGGGDGDDCGRGSNGGVGPGLAALLQTLTEGQSNLRAEVPTTALETQNAVQQAISSLALGTQQGFANTGDKVQNSATAILSAISGTKDSVMNNATLLSRDIAALNQNVSSQGCQTRETVLASENRIISKLDQNTIDELRSRAERAERNIEVNALRSQVEITNTNTATATQSQSQAQFQFQLQDLNNKFARICDRIDVVHQEQRSTNANIIAGNTGAVTTGPQSSTPTNVNAR